MWCGLIFFLTFAPFEYAFFKDTYSQLVNSELILDGFQNSPAYWYTAKLFTMITPDYRIFSAVWALTAAACLSLYIYKYCFYTASSAIAAAVSGIYIVYFFDPVLFMGMMAAAFAFRYACEKRFVRFCGFMLLAACFKAELILLIPLYFVFITKPTLYHIPAALISAAILFFFDFSFLFYSGEKTGVSGFTLYLALVIVVRCAVSAAVCKAITRRGEYNSAMVTVSAVSAVFAIASLSDSRFFPLASVCFYSSTTVLLPEIIAFLKALVSLTFKEKKKLLLVCFNIIITVGAVFTYCFILFKSGILPADTWLGEGVYIYELLEIR